MYNLLNFTITLNSSKDFLKLNWVIHVLAAIVLWQSSLSLGFILPVFAVLISSCLRCQMEQSIACQQLAYVNGTWCFVNKGLQQEFTALSVGFDAGFFMQLCLSSPGRKVKKIWVFKDQLTREEERALRITSMKIHSRV